MSLPRATALLIGLCALGLVAPAPARAAEPAASEKGERADKKPKAEKRVLRLEEFTVEGRIQKPQAFFILQRSNLNFEGSERKESFLPKIQKSCEKDPF